MKTLFLLPIVLASAFASAQSFDTTSYALNVRVSESTNDFFKKDSIWRGADGASSVDLGDGRILWLFGDTFIANGSSTSRKSAEIIRNSIGIQKGRDLKSSSIQYYWNKKTSGPQAFFQNSDEYWFWTGHGIMIRDKLVIFLFKEHEVKTGLGFETIGWSAVLISNPKDDPENWRMQYLDSPETFGTIAGSAAAIKDKTYLYAYGAVEPGNHEVYLLRWKLDDAYKGNLSWPEWWMGNVWMYRKAAKPQPSLLFTGSTEYSVHYDKSLTKFIQVQSYGFGEAKLGIRMSEFAEGPWTEPYYFHVPIYSGIKRPFMYSAKAHPELNGEDLPITYNVNSFDFEELLEKQIIYFPKFVFLKITRRPK